MPRTVLPDARVSPRFAGIATFGRYPRLDDVAPENRPVDWALFGVPFDGGVTFRPGARFGPRAIREASQYLKRFHVPFGVDICERFSLADAGDAPVFPYDLTATLDQVADFATSLADDATRLLAVGGDHSIAYANIRAAYLRRGEPAGGLALVHVDSHLDTTDQVWGCKWGHASPFRRAIEEGLVNPKRMISIGIKGPLNAAADLDFAAQHGVTLVMAEEIAGCGPSGPGLARIKAFAAGLRSDDANQGGECYISFDIDAVDPAFAPGTGTPAPGGLTSAEAFAVLRSLRGIRLAGADVVEVLPDRDPSGITTMLASQVLFEIVSL
ncbi:MAG: agmatinase, partial [Phycisphaerae bacterium]|nr:agmatinase [Phycisphaerae bacterium]